MKPKYLFCLLLILLLLKHIDTRSSSSKSRGSSRSRSSSPSKTSSSSSKNSGSSSSSRGSSASRSAFASKSNYNSHTNSVSNSQPIFSSSNPNSNMPSGISINRNNVPINNWNNNSPKYPYYQPVYQPQPIYPSRSGSNGFVSNFASSAISSAVGRGIGNYIGNSIFRHNNQNYYYGRENYKPEESGDFMCSLPIEHLKNYTNGTCYDENTRTVYNVPNYNEVILSKNVTTSNDITWSCKTGKEICCCTECCTFDKIKH